MNVIFMYFLFHNKSLHRFTALFGNKQSVPQHGIDIMLEGALLWL